MNNFILGLMIVGIAGVIYWVLIGERKQKEMLK